MPKQPAKKKVEAAIEQLDRVRNSWLRRPNVTAVDVGFKIKEREITDQLAVRVHVERKLPPESLETYERFNAPDQPESVGDFPVDVIEATYGPTQAPALVLEAHEVDRRDRVDPLVGGVSVGNPRVTAGTLGAIVWDRKDCKVCILSNWHVLVGSPTATAGEAIYQPGVADGGRARDTVAQLKRWRLDKNMDAALAELDGSRGHSRDILGLSPIGGIEEAALGMQVVKSGRTTGVTEGIVDGVSTSLAIDYGDGVTQMFHGQIHIVPRPPWPAVDYEVSLGGDSGSVWIHERTGSAVGLHFAGENNRFNPSPAAENAVANRMTEVAGNSGLDFSFTPLFCRKPPRDDRRDRDILRSILCRWFPWLCHRPSPGRPQASLGGGAEEDLVPGGSPGPRVEGQGVDLDTVLDAILEEWHRAQ